MWIRSQNKKQLVKCLSIAITRNFGGKKKNAIVGSVAKTSWWTKDVLLRLYDTEEIAIKELTRLQTELGNNTTVYEMK